MSATPDSTLADPQQIIAELQRQLAECRAERDQALQRETATAEVLGVINSSPGDLAPVFDAILEKAHTLCGATYGGLVIRRGEEFHLAAARGETHFVEGWRQLGPLQAIEGSGLARLVHGAGVVHLADAQADASYRNDPMRRRLAELDDIRTLLVVPLRKDDALLGVITAFRQEVRLFSDKQVALLQNFAAQAVIAMESAALGRIARAHQRSPRVARIPDRDERRLEGRSSFPAAGRPPAPAAPLRVAQRRQQRGQSVRVVGYICKPFPSPTFSLSRIHRSLIR